MRKMNLQRIILYVALCLISVLCLVGCSFGKDGETESEQTEVEESKEETLFLIVEHDMQEEAICMYSFETGLEYYYEYGFSTNFKDKYGNAASAAEFTEGRVITLAPRDEDGYLTQVQLSDKVWEYEKVRRFHVDQERDIFTIAETKYSIQDEVKIFSNGKEIEFSDISEEDILTVIGMERKVLSIVVTTGHGTLALKNTELFENSLVQLNTNIFAMITPDMEMEVPEGEYTLKVANDGWGGSTTIKIVRGETTEIDLDTLKGEGKKKGLISFQVDVEDVKVYVDYKLIDHTQPIELTYGIHSLKIEADGYDVWKKYLSVNSEEATIIVELTESESEEEEESEEEDESEEESSETESEEETETESEKENSESETESEKENSESETESEGEKEEATEALETTEV